MTFKNCDNCQQSIQKGHVLYNEFYYCSESCLFYANSDDEKFTSLDLDSMFEMGMQYYTDNLDDTADSSNRRPYA